MGQEKEKRRTGGRLEERTGLAGTVTTGQDTEFRGEASHYMDSFVKRENPNTKLFGQKNCLAATASARKEDTRLLEKEAREDATRRRH